MKKVLLILMTASMLILVGCSGSSDANNSATTPDTTPTSNVTSTPAATATPEETVVPTSTPTEKPTESGSNEVSVFDVLNDAANKTKNAKSFVINFGQIQEIKEINQREEELYTQSVTIDGNGNYTSLLEKENGNMEYYSGSEGYGLDKRYMPVAYSHYVYSEPLNSDHIFSEVESAFSERITNPKFLKDFCNLNPVKTSFEDYIEYAIEYKNNVTLEQFSELITGQKPQEDINVEEYATANAKLVVKVNTEGYLTEISMVLTEESEIEGQTATVSFTVVFRFSNIDKKITIEAPEWSKDFYKNIERGYRVYHCENGYKAVYMYETNPFSTKPGFIFLGMDANYDDELVVPVYKVLDNIEGISVIFAQDVCNNPFAENVYIEKLIIPEGVSFGGVSYAESRVLSNTEIYFEGTRESYDDSLYVDDSSYVVIGNENPADVIEVKAAYYADEWKYVDGVPTPK